MQFNHFGGLETDVNEVNTLLNIKKRRAPRCEVPVVRLSAGVLGVVGLGLLCPEPFLEGLATSRAVLLSGERCLILRDRGEVLRAGVDRTANRSEALAYPDLVLVHGVERVTELSPRRYRREQTGLVVAAVRWGPRTIFWSCACGDFLLILVRAPLTVLIASAHSTAAISRSAIGSQRSIPLR